MYKLRSNEKFFFSSLAEVESNELHLLALL